MTRVTGFSDSFCGCAPGAVPVSRVAHVGGRGDCRCYDDVESAFPESDAANLDSDGWDWEPFEPSWVREAQEARLRDDLAAATSTPIGPDALQLLSLLDPEALAASARRTGTHDTCNDIHDDGACGNPDTAATLATGVAAEARRAAEMLLDGVTVTQRLINHVQAIQQRLIAAFCRPGVAIPVSDLIDLAGDDLGGALLAAAAGVPPTDPVVGNAASPRAHTARAVADAATGNGSAGPDRAGAFSEGVPGLLREAVIKTAAAELGCALRLAPVTARMRCETALDLVDHLPGTVAAQQSGDLESYRARLIADKLSVLPVELRGRVERRILPVATTRTLAGLRRVIDREVIAADPAAARRRVERAKASRTVYTTRGENDTGIFTAVISATDAELASATLDTIAASLTAAGLTDGRTTDQLRADAFTDLVRTLATTGHATIGPHLAGGACAHDNGCGRVARDSHGDADRHGHAGWCGVVLPWGRPGSTVTLRRPVALNVYLNAATLAGLDDQPGELVGVGAITADPARALAASADTIRAILTRPAAPDRTCETILDAGRAVYRPPDATADYVTARDRTCTFPGCRTTARRCDLDHRRPYDDGGDTCPHNLDALCRTHHRLKTFTAWRAAPDPDTGRLVWTSPLGRHYPAEQTHLLHDRIEHADEQDTFAAKTGGTGTGRSAPDDPPPF
jgi:hypothetical protein